MISSIGAPAGITTVSMSGAVGTSNNGVLACGGMPAASTASFDGECGARCSSRAWKRHAEHAMDT
jgi:hypothetical protein